MSALLSADDGERRLVAIAVVVGEVAERRESVHPLAAAGDELLSQPRHELVGRRRGTPATLATARTAFVAWRCSDARRGPMTAPAGRTTRATLRCSAAAERSTTKRCCTRKLHLRSIASNCARSRASWRPPPPRPPARRRAFCARGGGGRGAPPARILPPSPPRRALHPLLRVEDHRPAAAAASRRSPCCARAWICDCSRRIARSPRGAPAPSPLPAPAAPRGAAGAAPSPGRRRRRARRRARSAPHRRPPVGVEPRVRRRGVLGGELQRRLRPLVVGVERAEAEVVAHRHPRRAHRRARRLRLERRPRAAAVDHTLVSTHALSVFRGSSAYPPPQRRRARTRASPPPPPATPPSAWA